MDITIQPFLNDFMTIFNFVTVITGVLPVDLLTTTLQTFLSIVAQNNKKNILFVTKLKYNIVFISFLLLPKQNNDAFTRY